MNFIPAFFVFSDLQQIVEERRFLTTNPMGVTPVRTPVGRLSVGFV
jgi:hypothetical protein